METIFIGGGLLSAIVLLWFGTYYWLNPRVASPDGVGCLTGSCGDTMELRLKFGNNRVTETSHWTNGCLFSLNCIVCAADLAKGMAPEELLDVSPEKIADSIGGLPADHMHCATLAVATLREAVDDYMKKRV